MILYPGCSREEQGRQLQGGADGRDPSSLPLAGLPLAGLPLSVRTELLAAVASALPYYSDPDQVRGQGGGQREGAGGRGPLPSVLPYCSVPYQVRPGGAGCSSSREGGIWEGR